MKPSDLLNKQAPDFNLPDQNIQPHKLSDYAGKWLILYFYPKDDTPGCTTEACSFRDNLEGLKKEGVEVVGVSKDTVSSHEKFVNKYNLNFTLLADPQIEIIKAYGAWGKKKFMGKEFEGTLRTTFLINPEGKIVKVYEGVKPQDHALQIENDFKSLSNAV